jgi:uncharacterized protein involved in response to NO
MEARNPMNPAAAWLRSLSAVVYLLVMAPLHRQSLPLRTVSLATQLAILALFAGLVFPLFWPAQRLAGLHVIYLGGFSLITFTVATRVVLGHSSFENLCETRLPSLQIATILLLAGAAMRAYGDFTPSRSHWLSHASYLWLLAAAVWAFRILPKVRIPDPDDEHSDPAHPPRAGS